ncbi:hypothetical protein [Arthrobacter celericrescens]|uniref:hypothetical protein n=1 Tax=Arthrobacter celericrescens TaxID=2320851 RepID=UPI0013C42510|nr:hypothetical protein [Arthrobacter celericrescens]
MGKQGVLSVIVVAAGVLLAGCGTAPPPGQAVTSSPGPTAACPYVPEHPQPSNCASYDPEAAMAENEQYREQRPLSAETKAEHTRRIPVVRKALEALADPADSKDVERALDAIGVNAQDAQTDDTGSGIRFGVPFAGGCLVGFVGTDGKVEVSSRGSILDGGCLEMSGH